MMGGSNKFQEPFVCHFSSVIKTVSYMRFSWTCLHECLRIMDRTYVYYIFSHYNFFFATSNYLLYFGYIKLQFSLVNVNILTHILTFLQPILFLIMQLYSIHGIKNIWNCVSELYCMKPLLSFIKTLFTGKPGTMYL